MNDKKRLIIFCFIIIVLILTGIGLYYLYSNKDNNIKYYTKEEVRTSVHEFPYSVILDSKHTYEDVLNAYKFKTVYKHLEIDTNKELELNKNNINKEEDINGKSYEDYSQTIVKECAKSAGLTVDEIDNRDDLFLWSTFAGKAGRTHNFTINGDEFKNAYVNLFGNDNMFDNSILIDANILEKNYFLRERLYLFDKNINKIIVHTSPIMVEGQMVIEIVNEEETKDEYIVEFVEGFFHIFQYNPRIYNLEGTDIEVDSLDDINELRRIVNQNVYKLKTYKVIFNKTKKGYTYKSVI